MRRVHALLAVAAVFALAGCLAGSPGTDAPADTPDATTTPASTTTTTAVPRETDVVTTTRTPTTPPATTTTVHVVAYESLSEQARRIFRWGLENGTLQLNERKWPGVRGLLVDWPTTYVRYEGERYAVRARRDRLPARDVLGEVRSVATAPGTVVAYANLSERGREAFDAVRTGNESTVWLPQDYGGLPGGYQDPGFVRYEGSIYRLEYALGDVYEYDITVGPAED